VAAVLRALQLNNYQICLRIDAQEVDSPRAVEPVTELLGDDHQSVVQDADLLPQHALDVLAFHDALGAKRGLRDRLQFLGCDLEDGHFVFSLRGAHRPPIALHKVNR
jgi:hypothetical protein